jgi:hypothetical protein
MRGFAVFAVALAVLAAGSAAGSSPRTALTVTYWEQGRAAGDKIVWTLACSPARGTLTHPGVACRRLAAGGRKLFAPVPKNVACTEIYGGPQEALVVGSVQGRRVWARFARRNGCEIARWSRISPWLLPPGGVS